MRSQKKSTNSGGGGNEPRSSVSSPRKAKNGGRLRAAAKKGPKGSKITLEQLAMVVARQHALLAALKSSPLSATLFKPYQRQTLLESTPTPKQDVKPHFVEAERRSDLGDLGDGISQSIRSIRRLMNVETKSFDAAGASTLPTTTGTVLDLVSAIAQGTADNQRIGDSIKVLRLIIRMTVTLNAAGSEQYVYMLVARSHDEIMTAAQLNILDANAYAHIGGRQYDYKDQYRELWSRRIRLDPEHQTEIVICDLKLNDHVQYNAGSSTVNSGCLMFAIWSNTTANNPTVSYVLTVEYVDN